jgi:hypothetical protein
VGLPVWLGTIPNVPNSLDASQLSTLCHGHHVDVPSSTKSSPPPSTFSGESIATSNQKSKIEEEIETSEVMLEEEIKPLQVMLESCWR